MAGQESPSSESRDPAQPGGVPVLGLAQGGWISVEPGGQVFEQAVPGRLQQQFASGTDAPTHHDHVWVQQRGDGCCAHTEGPPYVGKKLGGEGIASLCGDGDVRPRQLLGLTRGELEQSA